MDVAEPSSLLTTLCPPAADLTEPSTFLRTSCAPSALIAEPSSSLSTPCSPVTVCESTDIEVRIPGDCVETVADCDIEDPRNKNTLNSSKHKNKFDVCWKAKYPWVQCQMANDKETIFCTLCIKYQSKSSMYKNSPWILHGYATVRLDKLKEHSHSEMHNQSIEAEMIVIDLDGKAEGKIDEDSDLFKAVQSGMKCLNFLITHNISLSTFKPLIDFCIHELHSPVLQPLRKARNASYTSNMTTMEFLTSMATVQREHMYEKINASPCFSVMVDETSDCSTRKHLAVSIKYLDEGKPAIAFIENSEIANGKAETIFSSLTTTIEKCGNFEKVSGFASDGASAMVGRKEGVATKVMEQNKKVISIHCHNHRLALAAKDSFESLTSFIKLDEVLTALFKYYKYSSVRSHSLAEIQQVLGKGKGTKLKKVGYTRWLSHEAAVNSVRINYESLLLDLENAVVSERSKVGSGPTAAGLLKHLKDFEFFQNIHFLCDVLGVMSKLTIFFQQRSVDLSVVEGNVSNTLNVLQKLRKKPGGTFCKKLDERARQLGIPAPIGQSGSSFENNARAFIDHLKENISVRLSNSEVISQLGVLDLTKVNCDTMQSVYGNSEILELAEFFDLDEDELLEEWIDFKSMYCSEISDDIEMSMTNLCCLLTKSEATVGQRFPLIQKLLNIACTLPMSTAEVERVFSQVKLIVTDHRNRLKVNHVNDLLMLKLNGGGDFRKAALHWKRLRNRRLFL